MNKGILSFLLFAVVTTAAAQVRTEQLKAKTYSVAFSTSLNAGGVQQVININFTGTAVAPTTALTAAQIQITGQDTPALPPFITGTKLVIYAAKDYFPVVMDLINRSLENKKFSLVFTYYEDLSARVKNAYVEIK